MAKKFKLFWLMCGIHLLFINVAWPIERSMHETYFDTNLLETKLAGNVKLGIKSVDFPRGLEWFNTKAPLQMKALRGKAVLLDFWTFCCINCMHVIPELKQLEADFPNELVVVGIHSAKFASEREAENVRQSILRYEIKHPVVNDPTLSLWSSYGIHAWPTLILIDPNGNVVLTASGEGHYELLKHSIQILTYWAKQAGTLNVEPVQIALEESKEPVRELKYPGKIFADAKGLVMSDSGHNQILLSSFTGSITETVGSGDEGTDDGTFETAKFNHPQGVFREGNQIYVADTQNHLLRLIDLEKRMVETLAGTGKRGSYLSEESPARTTALASPWAVVKVGQYLYVAMAGPHQIWALNLKTGELNPFAGGGREDITDGMGLSAALAQPSGITYDGASNFYFADSEVSAVRSVQLKTREVKTLIGRGLFDFGDVDGFWERALFQHPLDVAFGGGETLYVADTYNDKIKMIDLKKGTVSTILGTGKPGLKDGAPGALYEPGGLAFYEGKLYIADTNNHAIRVWDASTKMLETLKITRKKGKAAQEPPSVSSPAQNPFLEAVTFPKMEITSSAQVEIKVNLPKDHDFTEGVPLQYEVMLRQGEKTKPLQNVSLDGAKKKQPIQFQLNEKNNTGDTGEMALEMNLEVPYCTTRQPKLCKFKSLKLTQPILITENGRSHLSLRAEIH